MSSAALYTRLGSYLDERGGTALRETRLIRSSHRSERRDGTRRFCPPIQPDPRQTRDGYCRNARLKFKNLIAHAIQNRMAGSPKADRILCRSLSRRCSELAALPDGPPLADRAELAEPPQDTDRPEGTARLTRLADDREGSSASGLVGSPRALRETSAIRSNREQEPRRCSPYESIATGDPASALSAYRPEGARATDCPVGVWRILAVIATAGRR